MTARGVCVAVLAALAVSLGGVAGCGGKPESPPPEKPAAKDATPADDAKAGDPKPEDKKADPPKPTESPAVWEMDPDVQKAKLPAGPPAGVLGGVPFAPTAVKIKGGTLTLSAGAERSITIELPLPTGQVLEKRDVTVRPNQPHGQDVPVVTLRTSGKTDGVGYINGYALTLKLDARAGRTIPGKIYLSMPGDDKTFVAGTFAAEWERQETDPPGPDDAPYVQGKVVVAGIPDPVAKVGYLGQPGKDNFVYDSAQLGLGDPKGAQLTRSVQFQPRITALLAGNGKDVPARYEHVRLLPGRYLVYATVTKGDVPAPPAADVWAAGKWVAVAAGGEVTVDFTLDAATAGGVEATAPAATMGGKVTVMVAPAEEPGTVLDDGLVQGAALSMGLSAEPAGGKAVFPKLAPGRYEVRAYEQAKPDAAPVPIGKPQTVEVTAGKSVPADLTAKPDEKKT